MLSLLSDSYCLMRFIDFLERDDLNGLVDFIKFVQNHHSVSYWKLFWYNASTGDSYNYPELEPNTRLYVIKKVVELFEKNDRLDLLIEFKELFVENRSFSVSYYLHLLPIEFLLDNIGKVESFKLKIILQYVLYPEEDLELITKKFNNSKDVWRLISMTQKVNEEFVKKHKESFSDSFDIIYKRFMYDFSEDFLFSAENLETLKKSIENGKKSI